MKYLSEITRTNNNYFHVLNAHGMIVDDDEKAIFDYPSDSVVIANTCAKLCPNG